MLLVCFYRRARHICCKYGFVNIWDNVNQFSYIEVKVFKKSRIWLFHWGKDVASTRTRDSPFSSTFLKNDQSSTHPYKSCKFLDIFTTDDMPRDAFASVLRFWTMPSRSRVCPCSQTTCNIGLHLVFECPRTRALATNYRKTLSPELCS